MTQGTAAEREAFEAWWLTIGAAPLTRRPAKYDATKYDWAQTQTAWEAWQARASQGALSDGLTYATSIATNIWSKRYKTDAPDWKPLPDLLGVLTQIDNMTSGLVRTQAALSPAEPVAWIAEYRLPIEDKMYRLWGKRPPGDLGDLCVPLYTSPPTPAPQEPKT